MRKLYSKPEVVFENFLISTNIAAGCVYKTNLQTEGNCGYDDDRGNGVIFTLDVTGCKYHNVEDSDSLCYHNPSDYGAIFNS